MSLAIPKYGTVPVLLVGVVGAGVVIFELTTDVVKRDVVGATTDVVGAGVVIFELKSDAVARKKNVIDYNKFVTILSSCIIKPNKVLF